MAASPAMRAGGRRLAEAEAWAGLLLTDGRLQATGLGCAAPAKTQPRGTCGPRATGHAQTGELHLTSSGAPREARSRPPRFLRPPPLAEAREAEPSRAAELKRRRPRVPIPLPTRARMRMGAGRRGAGPAQREEGRQEGRKEEEAAILLSRRRRRHSPEQTDHRRPGGDRRSERARPVAAAVVSRAGPPTPPDPARPSLASAPLPGLPAGGRSASVGPARPAPPAPSRTPPRRSRATPPAARAPPRASWPGGASLRAPGGGRHGPCGGGGSGVGARPGRLLRGSRSRPSSPGRGGLLARLLGAGPASDLLSPWGLRLARPGPSQGSRGVSRRRKEDAPHSRAGGRSLLRKGP